MDDRPGKLAQLQKDMTPNATMEIPLNGIRKKTLLSLPSELRNRIWSYVLDSKYENVNHWNTEDRAFEHRMLFYRTPSPRTIILQVSRQLSEEGKYILYQHSTFQVHCDEVTGLTLPISLSDIHIIRTIELQVDHHLFLRRIPKLVKLTEPKSTIPLLARGLPTRFSKQLEKFGSSGLRAERCTFYLNTCSQNKEFLPLVIPVLHALKGFETVILKIVVCPPRFSSPPSAWLLSEPFKTSLESVLGHGEFTDDEGRCCLVFRPRDHCFRQGTDVSKVMLGADEWKIEGEDVDR